MLTWEDPWEAKIALVTISDAFAILRLFQRHTSRGPAHASYERDLHALSEGKSRGELEARLPDT